MEHQNSQKIARRWEKDYQTRRLDSIACLIRGNATVGAACFADGKLILATNAEEITPIVKAIGDYLIRIAKSSYDQGIKIKALPDDANKKSKIQTMRREHEQESRIYMESIRSKLRRKVVLLVRNEADYTAFFNRSLEKITRSIRHTYLGPSTLKDYRPLSEDLAKAILNKQIIVAKARYKKDKNGIVMDTLNPHAELKILQELYELGLFTKGKTIAIGVSKKCCLNCETVIRAVCLAIKKATGANINLIETTDRGSGAPFPADPPLFLIQDSNIAKHFLELRGIKTNVNSTIEATIRGIFKRQADRHIDGHEQNLEHSLSADNTSASIESEFSPVKESSKPSTSKPPVDVRDKNNQTTYKFKFDRSSPVLAKKSKSDKLRELQARNKQAATIEKTQAKHPYYKHEKR